MLVALGQEKGIVAVLYLHEICPLNGNQVWSALSLKQFGRNRAHIDCGR